VLAHQGVKWLRSESPRRGFRKRLRRT